MAHCINTYIRRIYWDLLLKESGRACSFSLMVQHLWPESPSSVRALVPHSSPLPAQVAQSPANISHFLFLFNRLNLSFKPSLICQQMYSAHPLILVKTKISLDSFKYLQSWLSHILSSKTCFRETPYCTRTSFFVTLSQSNSMNSSWTLEIR